MPYASSGPLISSGQTLRIRYDSPETWDTDIDITVQIGQTSGTWKLGNRTPRTTVADYTFLDNTVKLSEDGDTVTGGVFDGYPSHIEKNTLYYSEVVTLGGKSGYALDYNVPITISSSATDAAYRVKQDGGSWSTWRTTPTTVKENWQIQLRMKSSTNYTTKTTVTVKIGFDGNPSGNGEWPWNTGSSPVDDAYGNSVVTDDWEITTRQQDVLVDAFSFNDLGFTSGGIVDESEYVTVLNGYAYVGNYPIVPIKGIDDDAKIRVRVKDGKTRYKNDAEQNLSGTEYFAVAKKTSSTPPAVGSSDWKTELTNLVLNDEVWVRLKTGNYTTQRRVTVEAYALVSDGNNTSGSVSDEWIVRTEVDKYPDAFEIGPIYAVSDGDNVQLATGSIFEEAEPNFTYYGQATFTGFGYNYDGTVASAAATSNGQLQMSDVTGSSPAYNNSGLNWGASLTATENSKFYFRIQSAPGFNVNRTGVCSISGITDTMTIKTRPAKVIPYPWSFVDSYWPPIGGVSTRETTIKGIDIGESAVAEITSSNVSNALLSVDNINWAPSVSVQDGSLMRIKISNPTQHKRFDVDGNPLFTFATVQIGGEGAPTETFHCYPPDSLDIYNYYGNQASNPAKAPVGIYEFTLPAYAPSVFFNMSGGGGGAGGDDAPNSYGGPGGLGMRMEGVITNVTAGTVLQLIVAGGGSDGTDFTTGGTGGAGGSGYLSGGQGGNAGSGDKSGAGGGGGGASCIRIKSGDIIAIAGGGGGGAGAGNDTRIPNDNQYGNYNSSGVLSVGSLTTNISTMSNGGNGSSASGQGGGGGGGGAGQGSGGNAGSSDGDGLAGLGGGCYYNPTYFAQTPSVFAGQGVGAGEDGFIGYFHGQQDVTPDPFSFEPLDDLEFNTLYTSEKVLITGITGNTDAVAGGTGTEIRIFDENGDPIAGFDWEPGSSGSIIEDSQTVQVRAYSSPNPNVTTLIPVTIGGTLVNWKLTTRDPDDLTPTDFDIGPILNANLDTIYYSDLLTVKNINVPVTASVNTGEFQVCDPDGNCSIYDGNPKTVENSWTIRLKNTSASTYNTNATMTLTVGSGNPADFIIKTKLEPVTDPNSFIFDNVLDAVPLSVVTSTVNNEQNFYISGIGVAIPIYFNETPSDAKSASDVQLYINDTLVSSSNTESGAPTVSNGDKIYLKYTTASSAGDVAYIYLVVGEYNVPVWSITNDGDPGTDPDAVQFNTVVATGPNASTASNTVTASGFSASTIDFYVTGGAEVKISGGGWTSATATSPLSIAVGDTIQLRTTSSEIPGAPKQINVFLGAYETTWTVITPIGPVEPKRSIWYSEFTERLGLPIGSVVAVFKDATTVDNFGFGNLDGKLNSRFHGWIECDGRELSQTLYPVLYELLQNTYGSAASGFFRIPDFRNRKVLGTGAIDGQAGGSPSIIPTYGPDGNPGGGATTAGSVGGYWFIDTIDDPAVDPPEQVADGDPPIESDFFSIGQIVTTGYENVSGTIEFTVPSSSTEGQPGNVTGVVELDKGGGGAKIYDIPWHEHQAVNAKIDTGGAAGFITWKTGNGGNSSTIFVDSTTIFGIPVTPIPTSELISFWGYPFEDQTGLDPFITDIAPGDELEGSSDEWDSKLSPNDKAEIAEFVDAGEAEYLGAVSPFESATSVKTFKSSSGTSKKHNHYLCLEDFNTDDNANFTYGNDAGYGSLQGTFPFGEAKEGAAPAITIMFTAEELGFEIFPGTFSLNTTVQIIPTPALSPDTKVPLVTPYTRAKWVIRAF